MQSFNVAAVLAWLEALSSGEYAQHFMRLCSYDEKLGDYAYCSLGLGCYLAAPELGYFDEECHWWTDEQHYRSAILPSPAVRAHYGWDRQVGRDPVFEELGPMLDTIETIDTLFTFENRPLERIALSTLVMHLNDALRLPFGVQGRIMRRVYPRVGIVLEAA